MKTTRMTRKIEIKNAIHRLEENIHYTNRSGWTREEKRDLIDIYRRELDHYRQELERLNERKRQESL